MPGFLRNQKIRNILLQALFVAVMGIIIIGGWRNAQTTLEAQHIVSGFGFLEKSTGWDVNFSLLPHSASDPYWWFFVIGIVNTLFLGTLGLALATLIGGTIGIMRTVSHPVLNLLGRTCVDVFRNIPLIVQMFRWYFVLPELVPHNLGIWMKQSMPLPEFTTAVIALGFFTSARVAEQVRTGILALPRGQKNAGLAMGFTLGQTYRYVLLPMAYRIVIPPLTSEFMNIFKNSAVALAIGLTELTFQMRQMTGEYAPANPIEVMTYTSLLYLIVAFSVNRIMALVEKKVQVPGYIGGGK